MKFKTLLLTAIAAGLIPALTHAKPENGQRQGPPNHAERGERFANTDTNGDGQLSREELQNAKAKKLIKHFDQIDANGDGQLTKDEVKAAHQQRRNGAKGGPKGGKCANCEPDA